MGTYPSISNLQERSARRNWPNRPRLAWRAAARPATGKASAMPCSRSSCWPSETRITRGPRRWRWKALVCLMNFVTCLDCFACFFICRPSIARSTRIRNCHHSGATSPIGRGNGRSDGVQGAFLPRLMDQMIWSGERERVAVLAEQFLAICEAWDDPNSSSEHCAYLSAGRSAARTEPGRAVPGASASGGRRGECRLRAPPAGQ